MHLWQWPLHHSRIPLAYIPVFLFLLVCFSISSSSSFSIRYYRSDDKYPLWAPWYHCTIKRGFYLGGCDHPISMWFTHFLTGQTTLYFQGCLNGSSRCVIELWIGWSYRVKVSVRYVIKCQNKSDDPRQESYHLFSCSLWENGINTIQDRRFIWAEGLYNRFVWVHDLPCYSSGFLVFVDSPSNGGVTKSPPIGRVCLSLFGKLPSELNGVKPMSIYQNC